MRWLALRVYPAVRSSRAAPSGWMTVACLLGALTLPNLAANAADDGNRMPRYDHILVIIAENQAYEDIIGKLDVAPHLNRLAKAHGLATKFYGEVHPSEGNYVAMIGGDTFGIHDDDAWYCRLGMTSAPETPSRYCYEATTIKPYVNHTVKARSLIDQLEEHHLTWKGYFQDIPRAGSKAVYYPEEDNPVPGKPSNLYASKQNGFINFEKVQTDPDIERKFVDFNQLAQDLASNQVPSYAHIVPNQCDDMHGLRGPNVEPTCLSDSPARRIKRGDDKINELVEMIIASPIWKAPGNTAIVITWDEDSGHKTGTQGCCSCAYSSSKANFGGGHIPTLVITNHPRADVLHEDPTPYNHYSLLRTTEEAFGIDEYLGHANDSACGVKSMRPLFQAQ
jgi:hypothetical protein